MRCYYCGRTLNNLERCSFCGADVSMYRKAYAISNALYNDGLDRAGSRDLTGAIESLNKSLKFNKENIDARNLLGLIYYEIGELVDAISEWVISKNIQPDNNIADEYLRDIQGNPNKFESMKQGIKKYNQALIYCRQNSEDLAIIQLKKVIITYPHLVKAYQLLALLYFKQKDYEKMRKTLKKVFKINKTDPTTLRYMNELDKVYKRGGKNPIAEEKDEAGEKLRRRLFGPKDGYYERDTFGGLVNVIFGVVLGILATVFLIVPAVKQASNLSNNDSFILANERIADRESEINSLEKKISELETQNAELAKEAAITTEVREAYYAVFKLMNNSKSMDAVEIDEALSSINAEALAGEAKTYYDETKEANDKKILSPYFKSGNEALDDGKYEDAIKYFSRVVSIEEEYQSGNALLGLGKAYAGNADKENAKTYLDKVISIFGEDTNIGKKAKEVLAELDKKN